MEILSLNFLYFTTIVLVIYYIVPGKFQNLLLLVSSYYFYSTWSITYVYILLVLTGFNYIYAKAIYPVGNNKPAKLWFGVTINLLIFGVLLFQDAYQSQFTSVLNFMGTARINVQLLLPIGFSFYVLEAISYLIDVKRKQVKPSNNIVDFALYFAYFPKLISGPIERSKKFLNLLNEERIVDNQEIEKSITLILIGLLRALIFAKILNIILPFNVFTDPLNYPSIDLVIWIVVYAMLLYNQFAGYSNIVRGVSGLFGIELSRNFATPFFSKDFSGFWTRWHITLSTWLRDYVYLPMSRSLIRRNPSNKNIINRVLPPMVTMLISGLWHGANLHLLLWGVLMGFYMAIEQFIAMFRKINPSKTIPYWKNLLSLISLTGLGIIAMIPFRLDIIPSKIYVYGIIMANNWQTPPLSPFIFLAIPIIFDYVQYKTDDELIFMKSPTWIKSLIIAVLLIVIFIVDNLQSSNLPFVYP